MINKLAIVTVSFENYQATEEFLECFKNQDTDCFKIFVSDLSVSKKELKKKNYLRVISDKNKGYAYGVNLGLKQAIAEGFKYFVVINNDTYLKEDFVKNILKSITHHPSSIIGGKIYYASGYEYHKRRYNKAQLGRILWYAGGYVDWNNVFIVHRGVDEIDKKQYNDFTETEFVTGCLISFDINVINKVGFWDEGYFLYFEDADFCERAKRKQITLYYDPSIIIWHKNAQSTGGSGSFLQQKYQKTSRLRFGLKYAPLKIKIHLVKNYLQELFFSL